MNPPAIHVRLFGSPSVTEASGEQVRGLGIGKPLAIVAYLAVRQTATRDELVELLWGGAPEDRARNAFRQSLHRLRGALGTDAIQTEREAVSLQVADGGITVDLHELELAIRRRDAVSVYELYRGDFWESAELGEVSFDRWVDGERMQIRGRVRGVLSVAAREAMQAGDWAQAARFADRLTTMDPFDEKAVLLLAEVHLSSGQPGPALARLNQFVARTATELDLDASPAVRDAIRRATLVSDQPTSTRSRGNLPAPFVGREPELGMLMGAASCLREERGATVLITGESGSGKTRIVDELLARQTALGPLLAFRGRERPGSDTIPFAGIGEALRHLADASGVSGASRHLLSEASRLVPGLIEAFRLDPPDPVTDETGRLRFFEGVAAVIDAVAYEQPVAIVIEDVQHASMSTLDLVGYLSGRLHSSPVILILTLGPGASRPVLERITALAPSSPGGGGSDTRFSVALDALPDAAVRQLTEASIGEAADGVDIDRIVRLAAGQPGRVAEMVWLAKRGKLPSEAPVRLRDVLWNTFQTLTPSQRRVFFAASVLPRAASLRLLAAAAHLPEARTFEAATYLEVRGLLIQQRDGYALAHDSTSAFVVEASGLAGRSLIAGWAADALAADGGQSAELAHLYAMAGRPSLALENARLAAFAAAAAGAWAEAERLIMLAAGFAGTPGQRLEIESLRAGLGGGSRLALPSPPLGTEAQGHTAPAQDDASEQGAHEEQSLRPDDPGERSVVPPVRWRARILVPALVALAVSAAVWAATTLDVGRPSTRGSGDTLVLTSRSVDRGLQRFAIPDPAGSADNPVPTLLTDTSPALWLDSLALPWVNPLVSPAGQWVALERMTESGTDAFVVSVNGRDTVAVTSGPGDDIPLGWAPDGRALLLSRARNLGGGAVDSDLYRYDLASRALTPLDTFSDRSIAEAHWSPDGGQVAWVARRGADRQQDIFVARADGDGARLIAASHGEEYNLAWAPDGRLIGFTSTRLGTPQLFAFDLDLDRLWQLTFDSVGNDRLRFSPAGRFVAFESTRDGDAAVYVMPALGGTPRRLTAPGTQFSLDGWRGSPTRYVDRLRMVTLPAIAPGDTASLSVIAIDQLGSIMSAGAAIRWRLLSGGESARLDLPGDGARTPVVVGLANGTAVVEAAIPGWRADTLAVEIGAVSMEPFEEDFAGTLDLGRWIPRGAPAPASGPAPFGHPGRVLYPRADLQWESGVLSRKSSRLGNGFWLRVSVLLPPTDRPLPTVFSIGFTSAPSGTIDSVAPRVPLAIQARYDGAAGRVTFGVGDQRSAALPIPPGPVLGIGIRGDANGQLTFLINDRTAWRSEARFLGTGFAQPMRFWIGGRATGLAGVSAVSWR